MRISEYFILLLLLSPVNGFAPNRLHSTFRPYYRRPPQDTGRQAVEWGQIASYIVPVVAVAAGAKNVQDRKALQIEMERNKMTLAETRKKLERCNKIIAGCFSTAVLSTVFIAYQNVDLPTALIANAEESILTEAERALAPSIPPSVITEAPKAVFPNIDPPQLGTSEDKGDASKVEAPKADPPKVEAPKVVETPKVDPPKAEAPKVEAPQVELPKKEEPKAEAKTEEAEMKKVEAKKDEAPETVEIKKEDPPVVSKKEEPPKPTVEVKKEEAKPIEAKKEEPKPEMKKEEESKPNESPKPVEVKKEATEAKAEPAKPEVKREEPKPVESKKEETPTEVKKEGETKPAEIKKEEPKPVDAKKEDPKPVVDTKKEEPVTMEAKKEEPKVATPKKTELGPDKQQTEDLLKKLQYAEPPPPVIKPVVPDTPKVVPKPEPVATKPAQETLKSDTAAVKSVSDAQKEAPKPEPVASKPVPKLDQEAPKDVPKPETVASNPGQDSSKPEPVAAKPAPVISKPEPVSIKPVVPEDVKIPPRPEVKAAEANKAPETSAIPPFEPSKRLADLPPLPTLPIRTGLPEPSAEERLDILELLRDLQNIPAEAIYAGGAVAIVAIAAAAATTISEDSKLEIPLADDIPDPPGMGGSSSPAKPGSNPFLNNNDLPKEPMEPPKSTLDMKIQNPFRKKSTDSTSSPGTDPPKRTLITPPPQDNINPIITPPPAADGRNRANKIWGKPPSSDPMSSDAKPAVTLRQPAQKGDTQSTQKPFNTPASIGDFEKQTPTTSWQSTTSSTDSSTGTSSSYPNEAQEKKGFMASAPWKTTAPSKQVNGESSASGTVSSAPWQTNGIPSKTEFGESSASSSPWKPSGTSDNKTATPSGSPSWQNESATNTPATPAPWQNGIPGKSSSTSGTSQSKWQPVKPTQQGSPQFPPQSQVAGLPPDINGNLPSGMGKQYEAKKIGNPATTSSSNFAEGPLPPDINGNLPSGMGEPYESREIGPPSMNSAPIPDGPLQPDDADTKPGEYNITEPFGSGSYLSNL